MVSKYLLFVIYIKPHYNKTGIVTIFIFIKVLSTENIGHIAILHVRHEHASLQSHHNHIHTHIEHERRTC